MTPKTPQICRHKSLLTLLVVLACFHYCTSSSPNNDQTYLAGKTQYESLISKSEMPRFGACWKASLSRATEGCKQLTNTITHQLAYDFTRCFYMELGQQIPECTVLPETCKDNLDEKILHGTYAMFFMHTRDMCYFLENQVWQEQTQQTVIQLSEASRDVVERLENSHGLQEKIAAGQEEALLRQQAILAGGDSLANKLTSMEGDILGTLDSFQRTYNQQMLAMGQVFDKIGSLEKIFLNEYTGTQSFLLWFGALVISYLVTATRRTSSARLALILLTLTFAVLEQTLVRGVITNILCDWLWLRSALLTDPMVCVYSCVKLWRWMFAVCSLSIFLYYTIMYEDPDTKIYKALVELQNDIKMLKCHQMPALEAGGTDLQHGINQMAVKVNAAGSVNTAGVTFPLGENEGDCVETESDESSSNSDCTYQTSSLSCASSLVSASTDISVSESTSLDSPVKRKQTLLKQTLREDAVSNYSSPGGTRYNLRSRSNASTPKAIEETERQFVRAVKQLTRERRAVLNSLYT